jgi:hypothetical protein
MERHAAIEHLRRAIDEATGCAEQAGLNFVVLILDRQLEKLERPAAMRPSAPAPHK